MNKIIPNIKTYLIILLATFYISPLIITDTGSAMFVLLILMPLITFICSTTYGIKQGFNLVFPVIVAIIFTSTIFIHYNSSASMYILIYFIISLIGNTIGFIIKKIMQQKDSFKTQK